MDLAHNTPQVEHQPEIKQELKTLILHKSAHLTSMLEFGYPFFILIDRKTKANIIAKDFVNLVIDDDMWKVKVRSIEKTTLAELRESSIEDCTGLGYTEAMKALNNQYGLQPLSDAYALCLQVVQGAN